MIIPKYQWRFGDESPFDAAFLSVVQSEKLDEIVARLLWARGLRTEEAVNGFLHPELGALHDPYLLHDMDKAVARITRAIEADETILIYGDYDADGMTSSSIMKEALESLGASPLVYLPNRFTDGYGPNLNVYKNFIEDSGVTLIITVDNGVSGKKEIAWAATHGCDVVVTDHHSLPKELPEAAAIVHPGHPEGHYPFEGLCGAGVAFKVACALTESIPVEMLDLVAIGTIADMMPMRDENRILVSEGLKMLRQTEREGLRQLIKLAGSDLEQLTEETIGFQIAPRLNALGRLDDPNPAVDLLTTWDEDEAAEIAELIDAKNGERKAISEKMFHEAESMLTDAPVQVLVKSGWNKGVVGIVAGRLLEKIGKPVVLLAEENGVLRGSARSTTNYNLFDALDAHRELFIAFGGHAQAGGMTLSAENLDAFRQVLIDFAADKGLKFPVSADKEIAATLELSDVTLQTLRNLEKLAPFGLENPKPLFALTEYQIVQARAMGADGKHLKLKLADGKQFLDAVYFGHGAKAAEFEQLKPEILGTLSMNTWRGETSVQFMLEDARTSGIQLLDARHASFHFPAGAQKFEKNKLENGTIKSVLIISEIPTSDAGVDILSKEIAKDALKGIYFVAHIDKNYYLTGAGSRAQYATLYKTIMQYKTFDVRHKLKILADFVKIPEL
ncbi:MAG: single-stranded-DNA-specific exonuclease RecJ, partial [Streptococcaceae bacterium]|nr:single-stranded-DNA-specific exonuclease RecJ [Streptococcaceae bacterium]